MSSNLGIGPTRLLMGLGLSTGLFLVVITGAELFTGNKLMVIGLLDHQITVRQLIRNWISVYLGNFVGAIAVVLPISAFVAGAAVSLANWFVHLRKIPIVG